MAIFLLIDSAVVVYYKSTHMCSVGCFAKYYRHEMKINENMLCMKKFESNQFSETREKKRKTIAFFFNFMFTTFFVSRFGS